MNLGHINPADHVNKNKSKFRIYSSRCANTEAIQEPALASDVLFYYILTLLPHSTTCSRQLSVLNVTWFTCVVSANTGRQHGSIYLQTSRHIESAEMM